MPLIAILLFTLFLASTMQLELVHDADRQNSMAETRHNRTIALAQLVNQYLDERGGLPPASLTALAATPGYQEASQYLSTTGPQGDGPFLAVYTLNNGTNTYNRVIVYNPPFDGSITDTDYLLAANNACGTTAANQVGNWCGNPKGSYWITDTLSRISAEVARERTQQQQTLRKFAQIFNTAQIYPDPGSGDNSAATLVNLSGHTLTAATCTGVWQWQAIPLTCEDLYTIWGTPRVYNYLNSKFIALYSEAPWLESGIPIAIASQLDNR